MSKIIALFHVVFCTRCRRMTIPLEYREDLYRFIWKECSDKFNSRLLRIGGIQNHVHMFVNLHPSIALADFIKNIKAHSSGWMARDSRFRDFDGWAKGYFAESVSARNKQGVIEYIINQESHHLSHDLDIELQSLHDMAGLELDNQDMR